MFEMMKSLKSILNCEDLYLYLKDVGCDSKSHDGGGGGENHYGNSTQFENHNNKFVVWTTDIDYDFCSEDICVVDVKDGVVGHCFSSGKVFFNCCFITN